jgi:DNA-binding XRE family transcriptional regulator
LDIKISLAAVRVNANKTQAELAEEMQVTRETVNKWEKGKVAPTKAQIYLFAKICDFPVDNIFLPYNIT